MAKAKRLKGWAASLGCEIPLLVAGRRTSKVNKVNKVEVPEGLYLRYVKIKECNPNETYIRAKDSEGAEYRFTRLEDEDPQVTSRSWAQCCIIPHTMLEDAKKVVEELGRAHNQWQHTQKQIKDLLCILRFWNQQAEDLATALEENITEILGVPGLSLKVNPDLKRKEVVTVPASLKNPVMSDKVRAILMRQEESRAILDEEDPDTLMQQIERLEREGDDSAETRQRLLLLRTQRLLAMQRTKTIIASNGMLPLTK